MFFIWPYESFAVVLLCGAIWYVIMKTTRYVSVASMISLAAISVFFAMLGAPREFTVIAALLGALCVFRHRSNIVRLINGNENRLK